MSQNTTNEPSVIDLPPVAPPSWCQAWLDDEKARQLNKFGDSVLELAITATPLLKGVVVDECESDGWGEPEEGDEDHGPDTLESTPERTPQPYNAEPWVCSEYLHTVYDPSELKLRVDEMAELMSRHAMNFDVIAFRGTSGAAMAYTLSYLLGKPVLCVRKNSDNSHCTQAVEGMKGWRRVAIIDDFVSSGDTLNKIRTAIIDDAAEAHTWTPEITHVFLFAEDKNEEQFKRRTAHFSWTRDVVYEHLATT